MFVKKYPGIGVKYQAILKYFKEDSGNHLVGYKYIYNEPVNK